MLVFKKVKFTSEKAQFLKAGPKKIQVGNPAGTRGVGEQEWEKIWLREVKRMGAAAKPAIP